MPVREVKRDLPVVAFASALEWEKWLSQNGKKCPGIWLKIAKKNSAIASVSRQDAVDAALCHGWIDGQSEKFDDYQWLVRFTPRTAKSKWSQVNTARAEGLIAAGRMSAAGMEQVLRAKEDGRWQAAYQPQSKAEVPADLRAALDGNPAAQSFFQKLDSRNRYAFLYRLHHTKRAATRARKIDEYVQMLSRGEAIYPLKIKK